MAYANTLIAGFPGTSATQFGAKSHAFGAYGQARGWNSTYAGIMNITTLFKLLGAPLHNNRWSWGATRPDGTVMLRVWAETVFQIDGARYVQVLGRDWENVAERMESGNLGFGERQRHVELLEGGAHCILIMCQCVDPKSLDGWSIKTFDSKDVFIGGDVIRRDGVRNQYVEGREGVFVRLARRLPVGQVI